MKVDVLSWCDIGNIVELTINYILCFCCLRLLIHMNYIFSQSLHCDGDFHETEPSSCMCVSSVSASCLVISTVYTKIAKNL